MPDFRSIRSSISKIVFWSTLVTINCLALFLILNLSLWGYAKLSDLRVKTSEPGKAPMWHKKSNEALEQLFPALSQHDIDQLISDSRRIAQDYDPYTQFKEAPYRTKFVNVDANGFRRSKNQGPWPPLQSDFVIFFYGGSTSFGYGVPDDETVASHLQEILGHKLGIPVRVYNFGRGAYFSSQERILFEKHLSEGLIPDMAIFMDGVNEFSRLDGEPSYTGNLTKFMREHDTPLHRKLWGELPLIKFINSFTKPFESENSIQRTKDRILSSEEVSGALQNVVRQYQMNRRMIEAISRDMGVRSVFVWQPTPLFGHDLKNHIFKNFDYDSFTPYLKRGYEFVAGSTNYRELGQNFIWLAEMNTAADRPLYVSAFHYGPELSRLVADSIADTLIDRNLIPGNSAINQGIVRMSGNEAPEITVIGADQSH